MATPVSSTRDGDLSSFASTIVASRAYHVLKIDGYSGTLNVNRTQPICSCPFRAGGHTWYIGYCPRGKNRESTCFISIYLVLDDIVAEDVIARATFNLLDHEGKPVPAYSLTTGSHNFSATRSWGYERFISRVDLERSGHLKDDCFSIGCHVAVMKEAPSIVVSPSDMHSHLGDLLSSGEGTDVEFRVNGETLAAHRCVLAARSPVFKAELFGPMKEGTTTNVIQIDDMEAQVFRDLLTFMYTDAWPEMDKEDEVTMAQHLLVAADRYCLKRLKQICEDRLCNHIDTASAATILVLAEQHHCRGLKEACFKFLASPAALLAVTETDGFEYLSRSCPGIMKELISKAARDLRQLSSVQDVDEHQHLLFLMT